MSTTTLTPQQIYRKKAAGEPIHPDHPKETRRHIISVLVENTTGALNRVTNLFSARGFNLESVAVGETDDPSMSRMTLVTSGTNRLIDQVLRHLNNLVDALKVEDLTHEEYVERELCLLKVRYTAETRTEIMDLVNIFRGKVIDINPATMTFELTGPAKKLNAFVGLMQQHGIEEIARSGRVAMRRTLVYGD